LTLFVAGVAADDADDTFAAHDFTVLTKPFNGRANLHFSNAFNVAA
jgi:hypothetical protein